MRFNVCVPQTIFPLNRMYCVHELRRLESLRLISSLKIYILSMDIYAWCSLYIYLVNVYIRYSYVFNRHSIHYLWAFYSFNPSCMCFIFVLTPSFLENLKRLTTRDYVPTQDDVLRTRVKTTGIVEINFHHHQLNFK